MKISCTVQPMVTWDDDDDNNNNNNNNNSGNNSFPNKETK